MPHIRTLGIAAVLVASGVLVLSSVVVAGRGPGASRFGPNATDNVWVGTMRADSYTAPDASRDKIIGRAGNDVLIAGDMRDLVRGNRGDDAIDGGAGRDRINGGLGRDRIAGGDDGDWIFGGPGGDGINPGEGIDVVKAGRGNDTILAVDGARDYIWCGLGQDTVTADEVDFVARNCEDVTRVAP
jgi:Ca2+-binding RTX toxin-like protein